MRLVMPVLLLGVLAGCAHEPPPAPPPVVVARPKPVFPPPIQAPVCAKPAEKTAFALAALRMQLSVVELTCDQRDAFNDFTTKFRRDIGDANKTLGAFFTRAYARQGQAQQDQYETMQINQTSQAGQYYGADFCKTYGTQLADVLALKDGAALADYATAQHFDQTVVADECPPPAAPAPKASPIKAPAKAPAKG